MGSFFSSDTSNLLGNGEPSSRSPDSGRYSESTIEGDRLGDVEDQQNTNGATWPSLEQIMADDQWYLPPEEFCERAFFDLKPLPGFVLGEVESSRDDNGNPNPWSERGTLSVSPPMAPDPSFLYLQDFISSSWSDHERVFSPSVSEKRMCFQCSRPCSTSKELEKHALESGHRSYQCPFPGCEKAYCRRDVFLRHRATHKEVTRKWQCVDCAQTERPKNFTRKDHYVKHLRSHHPRSPLMEQLVCESSSRRRASSMPRRISKSLPSSPVSSNETTQSIARSVHHIASNATRLLGSEHAVVKHIEEKLSSGKQYSAEDLVYCLASL